MNKKQVCKAIIFILIFLFILKSITYMLRTNGEIKDIFVGFYAEPKDTIDVIMVGSSPVYPFYMTPKIWGEYGITAYPLSSNVQRPRASVYLVKEALKTQKPKLFIFEMRQYLYEESTQTENMAYTRGVTDNLKYSLNRLDLINALVPEQKERYTYYFDIFKYHSNWKTIVLPDQYTAFCYERLHPLKGSVIKENVVPATEVDCTSVTQRKAIPPEQEEVLYELLGYLSENHLDALFIVSPFALDEDKQMKFNYIQDIVESYGYPYLNMNNHYDEIGINFATDYYDGGSHTNASGAEKCTVFLGNYLQEHYDFIDKREQAGYDSWDKAYRYWQQCQRDALSIITNKVETGKFDQVESEE